MISVGQKRGLDELSSSANMHNGDNNGHSYSDNVDTKKLKMENNIPSKVVHLRNVPQDASENEIISLGLPFGKITNLVFARNKNQVLLEMADIKTATDMVNYYSDEDNRPKLKNRITYVQFSNHQELKTDESNINLNVQVALQAAQQMTGNGSDSRNVLRVIVEHLLYPVTIEVLKQIFGKFGSVLRIVIFNKNDTFQSLIEFADSFSAQSAKLAINGQNIYNGCCTLKIDYSKLNALNVKYNNDKSRDFTNPTLPNGDRDDMDNGHGAGLLGPGGGVPSLQGNMGMNFGGFGGNMPPSGMSNNMNMFNNAPMNNSQSNPVLLVTNLNDKEANPDALFTLFGVYGDVQRVKILYNKKDNALIQFSDGNQAQTAMQYLDRVKIWGKPLKLYTSKNNVVSLPKEGQPHSDLTKDFSSSSLHRFRNPNSKNFQNIFAPSFTLHLSNIPENVEDGDLKELFNEYGTVVAFRFFMKDRKMALVEMSSVEESVEALINLHNYQFGDKQNLRVSFTKSVIHG